MTDVLAIAEHRQGTVRDVSFEVIAAGRELVDTTDGSLSVAIIGGPVDTFATELDLDGVDTVYTIAEGTEFNHDIYVQAATQLAEHVDPSVVLVPNTVNGLDYAPALATSLDFPLVTDGVGLDYRSDTLIVTREMYGSKVEVTIEVNSPRVLVTTRAGEWEPIETTGDARVEPFVPEFDVSTVRSEIHGFEEVAAGDVDITEADILVSVGRGIDDEENISLIEQLAEALGATVSASRPIVDAGWLPKNRQVGQSGKTVTPAVYIAIGISGAVQHIAGMKGAETIIAINTDPNAPIFDIADYGIVDDLFEVVPALIDQFDG